MKRLSFALFFISLSVFSNTDRNCDISAPSTNLAACYESKSKQADAELNKTYNNLNLHCYLAVMISNLKKNTGVNWFNPKDIGLSSEMLSVMRGELFLKTVLLLN
ncbi:hypothetical protein ACTG18_13560 [Aeromonas hydrophila]|uniref:hypothetical protein n=1 Tax=Aeromonas hydrophila TaxID=644 RepID=UPI003F7A89D9